MRIERQLKFFPIKLLISECTIAYEGECNNCRIGCPKIYAPVCTRDSNGKEKQFSNACEFESYNCLHKNDRRLNFSSDLIPISWWAISSLHKLRTLTFQSAACCTKVNVITVTSVVWTFMIQYAPWTLAEMSEPIQMNVNWDSTTVDILTIVNANLVRRTIVRKNNFLFEFSILALTVAYAGECHKCQTICLAIYKPVCAKDSSGNLKTYGNQCELDSYNCRYPYNGKTIQKAKYFRDRPRTACKKSLTRPAFKISLFWSESVVYSNPLLFVSGSYGAKNFQKRERSQTFFDRYRYSIHRSVSRRMQETMRRQLSSWL